MRPAKQRHTSNLVLRTDIVDDRGAYAAYADLVARVFDIALEAPNPAISRDPAWVPFAYFDPAGHCVACVEAASLDMRLDGKDGRATAIRLAAVDPEWRGRGLFRNLMDLALAWCATAATGPTLLYTEDDALYGRFGFRSLPQHAFVGPAPELLPGRPARMVDAEDPADSALIAALLAKRAPLSDRCAILRAPSLFMTNMAADDLVLAYASDLDALVAYELDAQGITLVDVVSASIPSLACLLGVLPMRAATVRVLFPPDRLGWDGMPTPDNETGLMARGALPSAMRRPFMLPPTTEF